MKLRRSLPRKGLLLGLATVWLHAAFARAAGPAADSVTAQALFDAAKKLIAAGQYAEACPKLEESQRLDPGSGTLLNLADCYEHQGKIATAWAKFLEASSAANAANQVDREREAQQRASAILPRLSYIVINISSGAARTAGLEVKRDGALVGGAQSGIAVPVDSGEHQVSASAPGRKPWETKITVKADAQTLTVSVPELAASATATPPPASAVLAAGTAADAREPSPVNQPQEASQGLGTQRTLALVAGGVGVIGLAVGSYFGLRSMAKRDASADYCSPDNNQCGKQEGVDLREQAMAAGNVATIAFIVGAAGAAGGAALWFTAPPMAGGASKPQVGLGIGNIVIRGAW
jgi:serine/threonine-protein kinase